MASANIYEAILAVMAKVGYVQKDGQVQGGGQSYRFAGEAGFIRAIRPAMVEEGIFVYPAEVSGHTSETFTTRGGSVMNMDKGVVSWTFVHAPSQTHICVRTMGAGSDGGDKSIPKMLTGALKYALRQTFLIETGDDPDEHSSDEQERRAPALPTPTELLMAAAKAHNVKASQIAKFLGTEPSTWAELAQGAYAYSLAHESMSFDALCAAVAASVGGTQ